MPNFTPKFMRGPMMSENMEPKRAVKGGKPMMKKGKKTMPKMGKGKKGY